MTANPILKSDHFGIEIEDAIGAYNTFTELKSDHFGIEIYLALQ